MNATVFVADVIVEIMEVFPLNNCTDNTRMTQHEGTAMTTGRSAVDASLPKVVQSTAILLENDYFNYTATRVLPDMAAVNRRKIYFIEFEFL